MNSIWTTVRTSLVQKVNDIRKSKRRKSQQQMQQEYSISSPQENYNRVSIETNSQEKVSSKYSTLSIETSAIIIE